MYIYIIYIYILSYIINIQGFDHSGDIGCSLLVNPSHTDESWEVQNLDTESITANQLIESLERNMLRKTWQLL